MRPGVCQAGGCGLLEGRRLKPPCAQDVRRYVSQIPSNELLAGSSAGWTEPATPAGQATHLDGTATGLSPVDEASTSAVSANKPSEHCLVHTCLALHHICMVS